MIMTRVNVIRQTIIYITLLALNIKATDRFLRKNHACSSEPSGECAQCDGKVDCFDLSDEVYCPTNTPVHFTDSFVGCKDVRDGLKCSQTFMEPPPLPPFPLCDHVITTTTISTTTKELFTTPTILTTPSTVSSTSSTFNATTSPVYTPTVYKTTAPPSTPLHPPTTRPTTVPTTQTTTQHPSTAQSTVTTQSTNKVRPTTQTTNKARPTTQTTAATKASIKPPTRTPCRRLTCPPSWITTAPPTRPTRLPMTTNHKFHWTTKQRLTQQTAMVSTLHPRPRPTPPRPRPVPPRPHHVLSYWDMFVFCLNRYYTYVTDVYACTDRILACYRTGCRLNLPPGRLDTYAQTPPPVWMPVSTSPVFYPSSYFQAGLNEQELMFMMIINN